MPYASHLKFVASGFLGTAESNGEIFSFGIQIGNPDGSETGLGTALFWEQLQTATINFFSSSSTRIHNVAKLTTMKASLIDANGRVVRNPDGSLVQREAAPPLGPVAGAASSNLHPYQVACVVSLDTPRRSRSGRGRLYLPTPGILVGSDGRIAATDRDTVLTQAETWIEAINSAAGPVNRVIVASSSGVNSPVTAVRVGRVLDTQRRRRSDLVEDYALRTV